MANTACHGPVCLEGSIGVEGRQKVTRAQDQLRVLQLNIQATINRVSGNLLSLASAGLQ